MNEEIQPCIDVALYGNAVIRAAELAIRENKANAPKATTVSLDDKELAALTNNKWKNGRVLRVSFLGGIPSLHRRVEKIAKTWSQYANVTFDFGKHSDAEIRISFKDIGNWSYLGTDALTIEDLEQPTMNLQVKPNTSGDQLQRYVLHEFGHALGCIHEHTSPDVGFEWNEDKVYDLYSSPPHNWPDHRIDEQILMKYSAEVSQFSAYDKNSIMIYPIPNRLTIGDHEVPWNKELSSVDKCFIGKIYPKHDTAPCSQHTDC